MSLYLKTFLSFIVLMNLLRAESLDNTEASGMETSSSIMECQKGDATQAGRIKDIYSGRGLGDVLVTLNGCSTRTDENGYYVFSQIAATPNATLVIQSDRAYLQSRVISVKETSNDDSLSSNFFEYEVSKYSSIWSYFSEQGMDSSRVTIPAEITYTDQAGNAFEGLVVAGWIFKDTMSDAGRDAFPGQYEGLDDNGVLVPFVSYGFVALELKDLAGNFLNISENITLKFSQITGTTQESVGLWSYDYRQGLWVKEGYAYRDEEGTYVAEVSHAGTWSLSEEITEDPGIFIGSIVDVDGNPLSDVRVNAVGENWIGRDLSTDDNGNFEIQVIPNTPFRLKAYNYRDQYSAEYSDVIGGIASGDVYDGY